MTDMRMLDKTRRWQKQVANIGLSPSAGGGSEVTEAIGAFAPGVRCLITRAAFIFGANIAIEATGSVSKTTFKLYDRKAAGTGIISGATTGVSIAGANTLTGVTSASFVTNEVARGDLMTLSSASDSTIDGVYRVASVQSESAITLEAPIVSTQTDIVPAMTGQVGSTVENTAALNDDIRHEIAPGGYILAVDSVIIVERGETDFSTSNAAAVVGPMLVIDFTPLPAV